MQQIADWLEKLDLGQYAERFAENEIDVSGLPHLTDKDLKDIGIPLGHRRKIFAAINQGTELMQSIAEGTKGAEPKTQRAPQRREITVLFSDLVGSTALSERLDAEDLREVISAYQTCVAEAVRRFDGFVAKYLGDGVLVYFGYPEAHEDDAARAVRAALAILAATPVHYFGEMASENDLRRAEELVAEGRRVVQQQKGSIIRLRAAGIDTWNAQKTLHLFEANLAAF